MKTFTPKPADLTHDWYVIDATDVVLGRLATQAATLLRGKNKPTYAPHADSGNHVIIINADKIALTKLDVLSSLKEIPLIVAYQKGDQKITEFDPTEDMDSCTPVLEMVPGWQEDISGCRTYEELPENARNYIETLERLLNHKIQMISVGARREQYLMKEI